MSVKKGEPEHNSADLKTALAACKKIAPVVVGSRDPVLFAAIFFDRKYKALRVVSAVGAPLKVIVDAARAMVCELGDMASELTEGNTMLELKVHGDDGSDEHDVAPLCAECGDEIVSKAVK